jgi:putative ABC transport system permease protein
VIEGRAFTAAEVAENRPVALVSSRLFRDLGRPLGRRVEFTNGAQSSLLTVIGVVEDIHYWELWRLPPQTVYTPYAGSEVRRVGLAVRTRGDPLGPAAAIRRLVHGSDPGAAIYSLATMERLRADLLGYDRLWSLALVLLGGAALFVAVVGIYGVLSYAVSRRLREVGIRLALGAQRGDVLRLVVAEGLGLTLAGLALGLLAALALGSVLAPLLFRVSPRDPLSYLGTAVLVLDAAFIACWLPARRALEVDPAEILRRE